MAALGPKVVTYTTKKPQHSDHPEDHDQGLKAEEGKGGSQYAMDVENSPATIVGQNVTKGNDGPQESKGSTDVGGYPNTTDTEVGFTDSEQKFPSSDVPSDKPSCFKKYFRNLKYICTNKTAVKSLVFNLVMVIMCNFVYLIAGFFANKRYLIQTMVKDNFPSECKEKIGAALWDVVLDNVPQSWNKSNALMTIADGVPLLLIGSAIIYCLLHVYVDIINHLTFMTNTLIIGNMIAENVTVIPSSYGRQRCENFM